MSEHALTDLEQRAAEIVRLKSMSGDELLREVYGGVRRAEPGRLTKRGDGASPGFPVPPTDEGRVHSSTSSPPSRETAETAETAETEASPLTRPTTGDATVDAPTTRDGPTTVDAQRLRALSTTAWDAQRAATTAGRPEQLSKSEFVTWRLRLGVDSGELDPAKVNTVALPEDASAVVKTVWHGFVQLLAVRWLKGPGEPTTFSRKFAAAWCGVSERQAKDAIAELRRTGYIRTVGRHRRANLYLPKSPE